MAKPVVPRKQALVDVDDAVAYYLREAGDEIALSFVDALERAYRHIGAHPGAGSARYAYELGFEGLRCWPVRGFPYLIFFLDREDHVDVWRILHGERDIPGWLIDPKPPRKRK